MIHDKILIKPWVHLALNHSNLSRNLGKRTTWVFQEVKAFLIVPALTLFAYNFYRQYRYRAQDEAVNEQFSVEEIMRENH